MKIRSLIKSLFWGVNLLLFLLVAMAWLSYYLPAGRGVFFSLFSFGVAPILIVQFLLLLFWMAKKSWRALVPLLSLGLSFWLFGSFYGFNKTKADKEETAFRVMSYNVRNLNKNEQLPVVHVDTAIFNFVAKESPAILAVQEANYTMKRETPLDAIYPYKFVDFIYGEPQGRVINALYTKYPIINKELVLFPHSSNAAMFVDVVMPQDTIRVFNVHLQSFKVIPDMEHLQSEASGKLIKRVGNSVAMQEEQAALLQESIKKSPHPVLLMGDFNNTQFSKVYKLMKAGFKDSFLESGHGFGKTYTLFDLPTRIDYIFTDANFEVLSHQNYTLGLSDHDPVMANISLLPQE